MYNTCFILHSISFHQSYGNHLPRKSKKKKKSINKKKSLHKSIGSNHFLSCSAELFAESEYVHKVVVYGRELTQDKCTYAIYVVPLNYAITHIERETDIESMNSVFFCSFFFFFFTFLFILMRPVIFTAPLIS